MMTLEEAIIHCNEKACDNSICALEHKQLAEWLEELKKTKEVIKSLKLQNRWKPSEEQIQAVRLARAFVVDDFDEHPALSEILIELEEQLKKLREE